MVIPLGGLGEEEGRIPVPSAIKERHSPYWWALFGFLIATACVEVAGQAIFNAVHTLIVAYLIWYVVHDACKDMSPICLVLLGFMSVFQGVLNLVILCTMLPGRKEQHTEQTSYDPSTGSGEYKVKLEYHSFFDRTQGLAYNLQSLAWLLSPIAMLLTAALCYWSHSAYEGMTTGGWPSLIPGAPSGQGLMQGRGGGGRAASYGTTQGVPTGPNSGGQRLGSGADRGAYFAPFGGEGQRLGHT